MAPLTLKHKKLWALSLLGLAIITTTFLATGISQLKFAPGQDFPLAGFLQALAGARSSVTGGLLPPIDLMRPIIACLWVMLIISIVALIISPEMRREAIKRFIHRRRIAWRRTGRRVDRTRAWSC